ncbi:threonine-phosphate decarboxylase [Calidifontibacter sp. DB0510]|uniref:Aminotransferase n=1 Tax=Metallococcus carri TaxID=1656884 RepID=A0A967AXR5_9MICO|nr:Rv2231c family pyridoxal phosphate-dependent protein CobC [Metallococcus carri]NHN54683.1 threonine-phosphate decarboxylase [Metallococcus carri]NOP37028.1 threonine-phosphate decarboxylase [Calidifontibacter sp. DB2511S]
MASDPAHRDSADPRRPDVDLGHHGDAEVGPGLLDFAVNVRLSRPPQWLADRIKASVADLAAYPSTEAARRAIAAAHDVDLANVLPTNGAAEAFSLVAQGIPAVRPLVVHPQFTEPEAALRAAGRRVERALLGPADGFRMRSLPEEADLVIIGNPTNPTGVLHPREALLKVRRPGRTLVIDEAFMDAVPGEIESLLAPGADLTGVLVIRSLTKTWGLAGLRAGYVVGDPALIATLARHQPPWSVSTPAAVAIEACLSADARAEAAAAAATIAADRDYLVTGLRRCGLRPQPSEAPFVLVESRRHERLREALRDKGIAVRRGDTFPGLGPQWVRIAVRDRATTDRLLDALAAIRDETDGEPDNDAADASQEVACATDFASQSAP